MNKIEAAIREKTNSGSKAFVAYITAGDPDIEATKSYCKALVEGGVDVIELGVPFSDPLADGPTNQAAAERALASGTDLTKILKCVNELRKEGFSTPIVLFSYLNPIFQMGYEAFAKRAKISGVDGVLVLDLPVEESSAYIDAMTSQELATVFLASPTTSDARLSLISRSTQGFLYYVSRTGVTGEQKELSSTLPAELSRVRNSFDGPIIVGFGISNPDQAKAAAAHGDGIVIGSAIVRMIASQGDVETSAARIKEFSQAVAKALN